MKEKLRVSVAIWNNLPKSNRQQLMVILGKMAYNALTQVFDLKIHIPVFIQNIDLNFLVMALLLLKTTFNHRSWI